MKLSTVTVITLFQAHEALAGRPRVIEGNNGQTSVVREAYEFGPKFIWNSAKNLCILRRHFDEHQAQARASMFKINVAKKKLVAQTDTPADALAAIQEEINTANEDMRKLAQDEIEVNGLLTLPASGLNLKVTLLPATVIEGLMPLIEGEPEFPAEEPAKK